MASFTKRDLIIAIHKESGIRQSTVSDVINCFMRSVTAKLAESNDIMLRNFGNFEVRMMKPKVGRNPKCPSVKVVIPARLQVKFVPGKHLKSVVQSGKAPDMV